MWKPRRGTPAVHGGHLAAAVRSAMALSGPGCPRCLPGRQLVGYGAAPRLSSALGLRGADRSRDGARSELECSRSRTHQARPHGQLRLQIPQQSGSSTLR